MSSWCRQTIVRNRLHHRGSLQTFMPRLGYIACSKAVMVAKVKARQVCKFRVGGFQIQMYVNGPPNGWSAPSSCMNLITSLDRTCPHDRGSSLSSIIVGTTGTGFVSIFCLPFMLSSSGANSAKLTWNLPGLAQKYVCSGTPLVTHSQTELNPHTGLAQRGFPMYRAPLCTEKTTFRLSCSCPLIPACTIPSSFLVFTFRYDL